MQMSGSHFLLLIPVREKKNLGKNYAVISIQLDQKFSVSMAFPDFLMIKIQGGLFSQNESLMIKKSRRRFIVLIAFPLKFHPLCRPNQNATKRRISATGNRKIVTDGDVGSGTNFYNQKRPELRREHRQIKCHGSPGGHMKNKRRMIKSSMQPIKNRLFIFISRRILNRIFIAFPPVWSRNKIRSDRNRQLLQPQSIARLRRESKCRLKGIRSDIR